MDYPSYHVIMYGRNNEMIIKDVFSILYWWWKYIVIKVDRIQQEIIESIQENIKKTLISCSW